MEQQPNFSDQLRTATTFPEIVILVKAKLEKQVLGLDALIRKRSAAANSQRPTWLRQRRRLHSELRSLDIRLAKHRSLQGNRKIPAAFRKRILDTEIELLRFEYDTSLGDLARGVVRARKKQLAELLEEADRHLNPPKRFKVINPAFEVGKDYPASVITKAYDKYVWAVLRSHFEAMPRIGKQPQNWRILASLPEKSDYLHLQERHFTRSLESLLDEAYSILGDLLGELHETLDDMSDAVRESDRASEIEELAQTIDDLACDAPTVPLCLVAVQAIHFPTASGKSNSVRANEAAAILGRALEVARAQLSASTKLKKADTIEIAEFCEQIEQHITQIESLDW